MKSKIKGKGGAGGLDVEERLELMTRGAQEVVTVDELREAVESGVKLKGYLGYEPSGLFHIGWVIWAEKVRELVEAGVEFTLLEATWHAWINDKFGGDLDLIRRDALYIRHALRSLGVPVDRIRFVQADELVSDSNYWALVLKVSKNTTLARARRALTIMGRREDEAELDSSKLIYPFMQVSDIFYLGVDIAVGGMDQRRAHMLARDVAGKLGFKKPIAIHTPLLTSLAGVGRAGGGGLKSDELIIEAKMSKSKPESTILIHDPPEAIREKIRKAYCPPRDVKFNPIIEINKYLLFRNPEFTLYIKRPEKYGGDLIVESYEQLEKLYLEGKIHPLDLKNATAEALAKYLEKTREYFRRNKEAREIAMEIASAQNIQITIEE